jgi:hypothetical protein
MFRAHSALVFVLVLGLPGAALAQGGPPQVISATQHDVSPPLRELPPGPKLSGILEAEPVRRVPSSRTPAFGPDPVLQKGLTAGAAPAFLAPATIANFDGIGNGFTGPSGTFVVNSAPPDTNGAVGPNHVVEVVNTDLAVFSKSGTPLFGPVPINTLWSGFGGRCATENDGDPVVVYDRIADRWIISQFQVTVTPFQQCVAVSATADPTGSYFRYAFSYTDGFPDYPKMGVWPDGYYITYNVFNNALTAFLYSKVCAFDRASMLTGAAATQQCFNTSSSFGGLLPADFDGRTLPAAGAPLPLVALGATNTTLALWKFHSDFSTPANATFSGPTTVTVPTFTEACLPSGTCVPQGGSTQTLDSLSDRLMYRAAYRNFGDHEAIVVNHAVAAGSSVGLRWYELRGVTTTPSLFQAGTFAPDAAFRWMGSAAMDQAGNIAIGYSVSSSAINPQIRITGRLAGDPAGTMTQGETTIIAGNGAQGRTLSRWGDYSSLSVDPGDDCTFYYSNEYIPANGTFNWRTRIASFTLPNCAPATPDFSLSASPAALSIAQGNSAPSTIAVTPSGGFTGSVDLTISGVPTGASASFDPTSTTSSSVLTVAAGTAAPGTYPLTVTGTSGTLTHTTTVTLTVTGPPPPPDFSLSASPTSVTAAQGNSANTTITVTPQNGFSSAVDLAISGLPPDATASFNPASTTSTSVLTLTAAATTPTGTYQVTVTGTSGALTHTATVTFVVTAPVPAGFSVSASPASLTVQHGKNGTYTVTITRTGGFAGAVALSVSALPSGVTAAFSPASVTGTTSTLTINAAGNAQRVTQALTITGTSAGQPDATATVSLTIR